MSTELDLGIAAMVGEMEVPECEHSQHGSYLEMHDDAEATHYVRGTHDCAEPTAAYAACPKLVWCILADVPIRCGNCKVLTTTGEMFEILGPVNK